MWTNILSNKYLYYGLAAILLMVLIYLAFFKDDKVTPPPPVVPLPNSPNYPTTLNTGNGGTEPIPSVIIDESQAQSVRNYSTRIHNDLDGLNIWGSDSEIYDQLITENDTILTAVYNDFNQLYYGEEKGTLTKWLLDDGFSGEPIVNRLQGLNLL